MKQQQKKSSQVYSNAKIKVNKPKRERIIVKCEICHKPISFDKSYMDDLVKCGGIMPTKCNTCVMEEIREENRKNRKTWIVCKDCGKSFYVKQSEADKLHELGYEMPVRCYNCRQKRKTWAEGIKAQEQKSNN